MYKRIIINFDFVEEEINKSFKVTDLILPFSKPIIIFKSLLEKVEFAFDDTKEMVMTKAADLGYICQ